MDPSPARSQLNVDQRRLTVTALLVLSSLLALAVASVLLLRGSMIRRIHENQAYAARLGAQQMDTFFSSRLNQLQAFLELPGFRRGILAGDAGAMRQRLGLLTAHDPAVERATVTDGAGRYLCSVPPSPNAGGTDLSAMDWYHGTVASRAPFVSKVFQRRLPPQHLVIVLSAPLIEQGRVRALLAILLDLRSMAGLADEGATKLGRRAILLDPTGAVVGEPDARTQGPDLRYASLDVVRQALAGQDAQGRYQDPLGGGWMMASAKAMSISGRPWALLVQQPEALALAPLRRLYLRLGLFALLALALAAAGLRVLLQSRRHSAELAGLLEQQNEELAVQSEELEQANEELQQQADELEQANEELQQQSEELEQQTDELGTANRELEVLRQGLEQTVALRTEELKAKEAEFIQAQKLEAVGRLAGGVAHDFNNLLTVVLGYVDLMKKAPSDLALREQGLNEIGQAGERGARLTHQLLAFARRQMLSPRPLELAALVEGMLPLLRRLVEAHIEIRTLHQPSPLRVMADATQLEQVLMNLCINARDAMPQGGKIEISSGPEELTEPMGEGDQRLEAGRYLLLQVRDSGHGMAPEVLKQAFEPFFTTKEVGRGSGLGLSMVHGAVRQAHGQVYVFSQPGHGTVFKIYLPAVTTSGQTLPSAVAPALVRGHERILLAEDNAPLRGMAARALQEAGYQVIEAEDGAKALAQMRQRGEPIHLLISDLIMPGGSGLELARIVAAEQPGLRILFISGYSDVELPGPGESLRWAFLAKPFNSATLLAKARECLDGEPSA